MIKYVNYLIQKGYIYITKNVSLEVTKKNRVIILLFLVSYA